MRNGGNANIAADYALRSRSGLRGAMPTEAGIRYAAATERGVSAAEYWITRFRG